MGGTSAARPTARVVAAGVAAVALLAAACSGGDTEPAGDAGGDAGEPRYGGELTFAITAETGGGWCLPEAQLVAPGVQVANAVYDTLTVPDADGDIVPFLAESVEPNDTFDSWTIRLRDGVTFHDGTPLTAEVVKNNLDAYRGAYPNRSPLLFRFVLDNIASVEVVDDLTVVVGTATPWTAFPWYLWNDGRMGIAAQAQLDDPETCDARLIGTGPFRQEEWVVNERFVASRFEDYWQVDADGNQLPYLDRIEFIPVIDGSTRVNMLEAGEVDVMLTATPADIETLESLQGDVGLVTADEGAGVAFFMLNTAGGRVFESQTARLAAAHAIDREEVNDVSYLGTVEVASGPFEPGQMGYVEDTGYPEFDPDRARELVEQYEREEGRPFEVTLMTAAGGGTSPDQVQRMFEDVGIQVNRQQFEATTFIDQMLVGEFDLASIGNHPGGDPDLQYIWWATDSPVNFGKIDDPDLQALLDRGRVETDPEVRDGIYQDVSRLFGERVYNLWQSRIGWGIGFGADVHGVDGTELPSGDDPSPSPSDGIPVAGLWVDG
jgi:peptide/nickel transport system substrate-binding protein